MAKKRISNLTVIFAALGAVTALQLIAIFEITDPAPMAFVAILSIGIGIWISYLIKQIRKGFNSKE